MKVTYTSSTVLTSRQVYNGDKESTIGEELIEENFSSPSQPNIKRGSGGRIKKKPLGKAGRLKAERLAQHQKLIAVVAPNGGLHGIFNAILTLEVIYILEDILKDYAKQPIDVAYHANQGMFIDYPFNGVNSAGTPTKSQVEAKNIEDNATHAKHYCIVNEQAYITKIRHEVCKIFAYYVLKEGEKLLGAGSLSVFTSDVNDLKRKAKQRRGNKADLINGCYLVPPEETRLRQDNTFLSIRNKVLYTKVVNDKYPDFKKLILSILASTECKLPRIYGNNPMDYFRKVRTTEDGIEKSLLDQIIEEISDAVCGSTNQMTTEKRMAYVINALKNKGEIEKKYSSDLHKPREPLQQVPETESDSAQPEAASAEIEAWTEMDEQIYLTIYNLFNKPLEKYLEKHASTRTVEVFLREIIERKNKERRYQTLTDDFYDVMRYLFSIDETFKQHFTHYETTEFICKHKPSNERSDLKPCSTIQLPLDFPSVTYAVDFLVQPRFTSKKNCLCGQTGQFKRKFYQLSNEIQYLIIDGREHPPKESCLKLQFGYTWSLCCKITSSSATLIPQDQVIFPEKNMPVECSVLLIYKKE